MEKMFPLVVEEYLQNSDEPEFLENIKCEIRHVDGTMNATQKTEKLNWLREDPPDNTCRILSNVRCLSEGMDVPALDGVLFLSPRKSMVEVVQSVGRVMRKAPGKDFGYVVLPIVIPADMEPHAALDNNKVYSVVWQVLQALRSHDDSFDNMINKIKFMESMSDKINIVTFFDETREIPCKIKHLPDSRPSPIPGVGRNTLIEINQFSADILEYFFKKSIVAKLVKKVGNPDYLSGWADDVIRIANTYIDRIKAILENPKNAREIKVFNSFVEKLKDDLNDSLSDDEVIEMLAQHMITGPAFEAVFDDSSFAKRNPVSISIGTVLEAFKDHHLEKEAEGLGGFYDTVKKEVESMRDKVSGIDNILGKQKIIVELYDKFFSKAFPKMTQRLGIVYTPLEVVDFILKSVNELLQKEFGKSLGSKNVHIMDPFTGTGSFITRLLQSGLIDKKDLPYKYKNEIHANEIVLLAYYIASINIESVYHQIVGGNYEPFPGISLTDTFQLYEKDDLASNSLDDNSAIIKNQKEIPLSVVISNPPYSIGQRSENDNNKNISYPTLEDKIRKTYISKSNAGNSKATHDSYIKAFRWASDQVQNAGIIAFVTNAGWLEVNSLDGMRKCFEDEFSSIYVFNIRGNCRLQGALRKKEGDNIFYLGTRAPISITFLVKNPLYHGKANIFYHDIGDYLTMDEKLGLIKYFGSISGIEKEGKFKKIHPNANGDWINQRDNSFSSYINIGDRKNKSNDTIFKDYSLGIATNRDVWCYNFSFNELKTNMMKTINFYNAERIRFHNEFPDFNFKNNNPVNSFVKNDNFKISWSRSLKKDLVKNIALHFENESIVKSLYRPFTKTWLYFNRILNEEVYHMPHIFQNRDTENILISVSGLGAKNGFSALCLNCIPDLNLLEAGAQSFPLFFYDPVSSCERGLIKIFDSKQKFNMSQTITREGLNHFLDFYPKLILQRKDIFYYIYGILHSPDYREQYANNLSKELPRIPRVKRSDDFLAFSEAGRQLALLHVDYDKVEKFPLKIVSSGRLSDEDYYVTQMKFQKNGKDKDLSTIIYNSKITLKGIPLRAYEYTINGKSPIAWVMKYQGVTTDKKSGIVNDANLWATETMNNHKYPLELLQRVITVSLQTLHIVKTLPNLKLT
jgi:predicted helicase